MAKIDSTPLSDAQLEELFMAARDDAPVPSDGLMARIMADAEAELRTQAAPLPMRAPAPRRGVFAGLAAAIGGWPALAGMVTATVAGVWIGFASPDSLNTLSGGLLLPSGTTSESSYDLEDMLPGLSNLSGLIEESQG